jgi:hypothetical protein
MERKVMTHIIGKEELPHIIAKEELARGKTARWFEGYRYGDVDFSFFLVVVRGYTSIPTKRSSLRWKVRLPSLSVTPPSR